jgi:2-keto-4-pentenoate hydratase/2-oxohepta-3-ene-1,7-dioic acid hydratase in catechol pathway
MRLLQFRPKSDPAAPARVGALIAGGAAILDLPATLDGGRGGWLPASTSCEWWNLDGPVWPLVRSSVEAALRADEKTVEQWRKAGKVILLEEAKICAPVPRPAKIICIGLNYRDHAAESNMPVPESPIIFAKYWNAIVGPDDPVQLPRASSQVDYEAEMAVIIGRQSKHVAKAKAYEHVFGYSCFNDVSARDFQFADKQWVRGKTCDTFAPMGPYVVTSDDIPNPQNLYIKLRLNGETMQSSRTEQLIFDVPALIEFLSDVITLEPGDVIATGTPPGVGFARKPPVFLKAGDQMEVDIEGLGVLRNPLQAGS